MIIEQFYLDCLSQASYLVADPVTRRAVVVDPRRDIDIYLSYAAEHGLAIELVVLTHVHADFIPGHTEMAAVTGAEVAMSERAAVDFPVRRLTDGERIFLGDTETGTSIEILATPGHTPESVSLAVRAANADIFPVAVLTGDTLFIGDVGRPDLLGAAGQSAEQMAATLYRSLHTRLLPLPDEVLIYPGHGAGSACGKSLSTETVSTMGQQRRENYALQPMTEQRFIAVVTEGLGEPPAYFADEVTLNRAGHAPMDFAVLTPASLDAARSHIDLGGLVIDVRDSNDFAAAHLRGSVNVGLSGRFAEFAAAVHNPGQPVLLAGSSGETAQARIRLARVGIDDISGVLLDPAAQLRDRPELARASSRLTATQVRERLSNDPGIQVVDVRGPGEHAGGALPGAQNLPLPRLRTLLDGLDTDRPVLVQCAGGYRSMAGASLLEARGFTDVSDLIGGQGAWEAAGGQSGEQLQVAGSPG